MKNILAVLVALFATSLAMCQESPKEQEVPRVNDAGKPYLTIITHADWARRPAERRLIEDIKSQPMLDVAQKSHFNHYTTRDAIYASRWSQVYPEDSLPALVLQDSSGGYWFKGSGDNVPSGSQAIFETLKRFKEMDPSSRAEAFSIMSPEDIRPMDPPENDDQEGRIRRPKKDEPPTPDSAELFGGKTPVRDMMASAAMIIVGIIAIGFLLVMCVIGSVVLFITLKFWK